MKVPLGWVREYVPVDLEPKQVEHALAMAGFVVDAINEVEGDVVFTVDVASNRPDALSILGIARELSAVTQKEFKLPQLLFAEGGPLVEELVRVDVQDADLCPRYIARAVVSVKIGPSPEGLQKRLRAVGLRPVNNIVDITNYVMYECGQPLHAFDAKKLTESTIVVRTARGGEKIAALDGTTYELPQGALVIADAKVPVAIAGVMGGVTSEIGPETRHVIIESALFDPIRIRMTSKAIGLSTDSSFRFERQADYFNVEWASRRAAQLMADLGGGQVAKGAIDANFIEPEIRKVPLRIDRIPNILGVPVGRKRATSILLRLGFDVKETADGVEATVPHWRRDVRQEIDLIEEVARIEGYDSIPVEAVMPLRVSRPDRPRQIQGRASELLAACGYREALTWSFLEPAEAADFCYWTQDEPVTVKSPDGRVDKVMRRALVPALLKVQAANESYKEEDGAFFEIAKVYQTVKDGFAERVCLAGVDPRGFRHAKGTLELVLKRLHVPHRFEVRGIHSLIPTRSCDVMVGDRRRGYIGEIDPEVLRLRGVTSRGLACFEVDFDEVVRSASLDPGEVGAPGRLLPVRRDLAVVVGEAVTWAKLEETVRQAFPEGGEARLVKVELFDIFKGKSIPAGKKSVAFSIVMQPKERVLQAEEIEGAVAGIVKSLEERMGGKLRGPG